MSEQQIQKRFAAKKCNGLEGNNCGSYGELY